MHVFKDADSTITTMLQQSVRIKRTTRYPFKLGACNSEINCALIVTHLIHY